MHIPFQIELVGDLVSETHIGEPWSRHHVGLHNSLTFDKGAEE